jgi:hypothetical protein
LLAACLGTCFLLELSFDPEDGGDVILWNVDKFSTRFRRLVLRKIELSEINVASTSHVAWKAYRVWRLVHAPQTNSIALSPQANYTDWAPANS